jgi:outer membrane receptor for Fe3+-dicitrate
MRSLDSAVFIALAVTAMPATQRRKTLRRSTDNNGGLYVGQPRTYYVQANVDV